MSSLALDGLFDYALEASADAKFRLSTFTIETWARIGAAGVPSGTTGSPQPYPIVTRDTNYYLGVDSLTMKVFARYTDTGAVVRSLLGVRALDRGVWYHLAATRDSTALRVYVNGELEAILWCPAPSVASTLPVAIGTVWNGTSATGFFHGELRNLRIWSVAKTGAQLRACAGTSASMGVASNNVDELLLTAAKFSTTGTPTIIASAPGYQDGTLPTEAHTSFDGQSFTHVGIGTVDTVDPPFLADEPATPTLVSPADMATPSGSTVQLQASLSDRDGNTNTVEFWGRNWRSHDWFTIAWLPDTQEPVRLNPAAVTDGCQWIVDNASALRIRVVQSLGDCVDTYGSTIEWETYSDGIALLEAASIPYQLCIGNHDRGPDPDGTTLANTYFGPARFAGQPYYLGHHGADNDNNAVRVLLTSTPSDLYMTGLSFEYDALTTSGAIAWGAGIAATYPNDLIVVVSHYLLTHTQPGFTTPLCDALMSALYPYSNVRIMGSGHIAQSNRVDVVDGIPRHVIMTDYQFNANGNDWHVRLLTFNPREETVRHTTRNTTDDVDRTGGENDFTLPCKLPGYPDFVKLGEVTGVANGATASFNWAGRTSGQHYEWFARARNGNVYRDSARRGFTVA